MKMDAEVWVDAPPETVWEVMLDLDAAPRFVPLLVSAEPLDVEPAAGSKVRLTFGGGDRRLTTVATVTRFVPPRLLALAATVEEADADVDIVWQAEPKDGGTLVTQRVEARFRSMLARLAARAFFGQAETKQREALDRFKAVVEGESSPGKPGRSPGALAAVGAALVALATAAHAAAPTGSAETKPFGLPFAEPPGLGTWYIAQSFGNTAYAFAERHQIYRSGQGMHMGLDLAAACGTPVVSIGDGTVRSVDGPGGSPPHNLIIDHGNGYVSLYGHLLERPGVQVGQPVARGEVVALSGDMYETCTASPHLHLEIRDSSLARAFNPVDFVEADWHGLLLLGSGRPTYQRDLDAPRRWQALDDQPVIELGGGLLNDYARAWPGGGGG